jgi:hypothetical protein
MEHQELSFTLLTDLEKGRGERKKERKKERKGKGSNATFLQRKASSVHLKHKPNGRPSASTAATVTRS